MLTVLLACGAILASRAQPAFSNAVSLGTVSFSALHQASGIAASRNNDGVLWTHNDAGDDPRIFAIDTNGNYLATFDLTNATHVDYEDIAIGPGPLTNVQYLYVGDIGDNTLVRSTIVVYQIPEPAAYLRWSASPNTLDMQGVRAITFRYPDGVFNAEALMVDPLTGDLFIATKQAGVSPFRLYDHPTMYQPLPNVKKDDEDEKVKPTEPPTRKEPQKDDDKKDKDRPKQK